MYVTIWCSIFLGRGTKYFVIIIFSFSVRIIGGGSESAAKFPYCDICVYNKEI